MNDPALSLLNYYEIDADGVTRHLLCFLEPVRAGAEGIAVRSIVGDFTPGPDGAFDAATFRANPQFIAALTDYMNLEADRSPEIIAQARAQPSVWLYLIDPRNPDPNGDIPPTDLVGCFAVDDVGQIVPSSFQYNTNHAWIDPSSGPSGILADRRFYDWLHATNGDSSEMFKEI